MNLNTESDPLITHNSLSKSIPNKVFLWVVNLKQTIQAQKIRCKHLKVSTLRIPRGSEMNPSPNNGYSLEKSPLFRRFCPELQSPSSLLPKGSVKYLRKVFIFTDAKSLARRNLWKSPLRLLHFQIFLSHPKCHLSSFLETQIHSKLPSLSLQARNPDITKHIRKYFPSVQYLGLDSGWFDGSPFPKFSTVQTNNFHEDDPGVVPYVVTCKKLKELSLRKSPMKMTKGLYASFQDLRRLELNCVQCTLIVDLSPLQNCKFLESFTLYIQEVQEYSLDFLSSLSNLKELKLTETEKFSWPGVTKMEKFSESFPDIKTLVKFRLIRNVKFSFESIRNMLMQNPNLRDLELHLPLQHLGEICEGDLQLPLERLSLDFRAATPPYAGAMINLVSFLKRHPDLISLEMVCISAFEEMIDTLLKSIRFLRALERLKFLFQRIETYVNYGKRFDRTFITLDHVWELLSKRNLSHLNLEIPLEKVPHDQTFEDFLDLVKQIKPNRSVLKLKIEGLSLGQRNQLREELV